jgi:hypothetical protein
VLSLGRNEEVVNVFLLLSKRGCDKHTRNAWSQEGLQRQILRLPDASVSNDHLNVLWIVPWEAMP